MFIDRLMLRRLLCWVIAFILSSSFVWAQQAKGTGAHTRPYTVVYKLKPQQENVRKDDKLQQALLKINAAGIKRKFPDVGPPEHARAGKAPDLSRIFELKYASQVSFERVKNLLLATGQVEYVEPLYERVPLHQPNDPASDSTKTTQYYLKLIKAYEGWAMEKGDTNVVIGILDTGFRLTHQELKSKIKHNYQDPVDGIDNDGDGYIDNFSGWDFGDNDNNVADDSYYKGHGTAVAGVAVASTNNATAMASVGYNIKFMPLKIYPSTPSGNFSGFEAIVYAANKGCSIINISWGGPGYSRYEQDIIDYVVLEKNVVVVAAGGNTEGLIDIYPASYNNVLSVGGTDSQDIKVKAYTHSYNIDLTAPSFGIYTTSDAGDLAFGNARGTSLGSPIVAACAALVRSRFPELNARQVIERLRATSDDIYSLTGNQAYFEMLGRGRVNLKRALQQQHLKSVRCTAFELNNKYAPPAGAEVAINASFTNFLAPTSSLEISLTTSSPYISISQNSLSVGSVATMATVDNAGTPFTFKVADNVPPNTTVTFRLGFKDGDYEDFQYFTMQVNPDYMALDVNNLEVTVNSKGNIGYNGFNFSQGEGIKYKKGAPLLFEGGLMIATSPTQVSDNLRSVSYENDEDFVPVSITRRYLNTPYATQEIRSVMHDTHNTTGEANVGVEVKQISYAWDNGSNQNFVILEYHIKNTTNTSFQNLYTGLFADWDIGEYYLNAADWDNENKLGYVYNVGKPLPYAGLKLLTNDTPTYYAVDNAGSKNDTINIEDDFTTAEKYATLSGGVARTKAGSGTGNNVSHIVGAAVNDLAPGETKVVAFALLVADNLELLQESAAAAQQQYISFRTSPEPITIADTACAGTSVTFAPQGGSRFSFYADQQKTSLLAIGSAYTLDSFTQETTIYIAGADSVFESAAVPATFSLPLTPEASFEYEPAEVFVNTPVSFINTSKNGKSWHWDFGEVTPFTEKDHTHTFTQPGNHLVKLTISDMFDCSEVSVTKIVEVKAGTPTSTPSPADDKIVQLYPNPTTGLLHIRFTEDLLPKQGPVKATFTDMTGKLINPQLIHTDTETVADLSGLPAGVYLVHITYDEISMVKRVVVSKQ